MIQLRQIWLPYEIDLHWVVHRLRPQHFTEVVCPRFWLPSSLSTSLTQNRSCLQGMITGAQGLGEDSPGNDSTTVLENIDEHTAVVSEEPHHCRL